MTGSTGLFTKKIKVRAYFDNAGGLRVGAPVRLEGVDIGNVTSIRVVRDPARRLTPVEVMMKITTKYSDTMAADCQASLNTAGVLGELFVDLDCREVKGGPLVNGAELPTQEVAQLQDVVRASQGTLQNIDTLVKRLDNILTFIQSGQGSIGKVIYDPALFDRANDMLTQLQHIVAQANSQQGSIGKLLNSDELYNNANQTLAKANQLMTDINAGKGTLGKLAKDEALAKKLDETITRLNVILDRLEKGEGTAGKLMVDPSLYNNADATLASTHELVEAIRKDPKKYLTIHLKIF